MTSHPRYPATGCTPAQRRAFEALCVGLSAPMAQRTIQALLSRGLIMQLGTKTYGTGWSAVTVPVYDVPLHAHRAWCEWCSTQTEVK